MAHEHSVYDTDLHFSISPFTREITNQSGKVKLIQYDHNSERLTFEVPRHVEDHDMSLCTKIEVHYLNVSSDKKNQHSDVYTVNDVQVSPDSEDVVIFSWLISGGATQYEGTLNFLIKFTCLTGTTIDYVWNTGIYSGISVASGMNNGEAVVEEYSDALAEWEREVLGAVEKICGTYYAIPIPSATDADISPWVEDESGGYTCVKTNKDFTSKNFILHQCSDNTVYTNNELKVTVGDTETTVHVSSLPENACVLYLLVFNAYDGGEL